MEHTFKPRLRQIERSIRVARNQLEFAARNHEFMRSMKHVSPFVNLRARDDEFTNSLECSIYIQDQIEVQQGCTAADTQCWQALRENKAAECYRMLDKSMQFVPLL